MGKWRGDRFLPSPVQPHTLNAVHDRHDEVDDCDVEVKRLANQQVPHNRGEAREWAGEAREWRGNAREDG